MQSRPLPPLPSIDRLAAEIRTVLTAGVGRDYRGANTTTPNLALVAKEIVPDPSLVSFALCGAAVEHVVFRLGDGAYSEAVRAAFGISDEAKPLTTLHDRSKLAAEKLGRKPVPLDKNDHKRMCRKLAEVMLELAAEGRAVSRPRNERRLMRWGGAGVVAVVLVVGAVWVTGGLRSGPSKTSGLGTPQAELTAQAARQLTGDQVPAPGTASRTLGFGSDPTAGVRPVEAYVHVTPTTSTPLLDSMVDRPYGVGDERQFLRVYALHPQRWTKGYLPAMRQVASLRPHDRVWLWLLVDNDAAPQPDCRNLSGPSIATNTRARLTVWDSADKKLHIVRAWVLADNAQPKWVTDAVAVTSSKPVTFQLDPAASWQYSKLSRRYATMPPLQDSSILASAGMVVGDHGLLGSCWGNQVVLRLVFSQR